MSAPQTDKRDRAARSPRAARLSLPALFAVCVLAIAAALILSAVPSKAHADTFESATAVVAQDYTYRYTEPSFWSEQVDIVDAGKIVTVTSVDDEWCTGTTSQGATYYIPQSAVRIMTEPNPEDGSARPILKGVATTAVTVRLAPCDWSPEAIVYDEGQVLQFNKYCEGWYMGYGKVGDKRQLVFVSDVDLAMLDMSQDTASRPTYRMQLTKSPTSVRKSPSPTGTVLTTMPQGTIVNVSRFNDGWYMATLSAGTLCYIAAEDVTDQIVEPDPTPPTPPTPPAPTRTVNRTSYALTLARAVAIQMAEGTPRQSNGAVASSSQVSSAMNPASYPEGEAKFFQFMRIDTGYTGVTAAQIDKWLADHNAGALKGQGATFVAASKATGINEVYLVAHAALETGWGSSTLSKGWYYEPDGKTYYNFYGYGASDGEALTGGRGAARKYGWDSPSAAITGYATVLKRSYIDRRGQNTVYKMRWSPEALQSGHCGYQYATDIAWPATLGSLMYQLYTSAGVPNGLQFDVPVYQ